MHFRMMSVKSVSQLSLVGIEWHVVRLEWGRLKCQNHHNQNSKKFSDYRNNPQGLDMVMSEEVYFPIPSPRLPAIKRGAFIDHRCRVIWAAAIEKGSWIGIYWAQVHTALPNSHSGSSKTGSSKFNDLRKSCSRISVLGLVAPNVGVGVLSERLTIQTQRFWLTCQVSIYSIYSSEKVHLQS